MQTTIEEGGGVSEGTSYIGTPPAVGMALPMEVNTYQLLKAKTRPKKKRNWNELQPFKNPIHVDTEDSSNIKILP